MADETTKLRAALDGLIARLPHCRECQRPGTRVIIDGWGTERGLLCDVHARGAPDADYGAALREALDVLARPAATASENEKLKDLLRFHAQCPDHAGACCAEWCEACKAEVDWERRVAEALA